MTLYHGFRTVDGTACVVIEGPGTTIRPLPRRLDLDCHSPDGFEWGYAGSGPAQLALALLADVLSDDARALRLHQRFKFQVIGKLDRLHEWRMTDADVRFWSSVQQEQEAAAK